MPSTVTTPLLRVFLSRDSADVPIDWDIDVDSLAGMRLPDEARRLDSLPLSDHVYRVLRDAICDGTIQPHEHLVQNQIAEQLEVSRTPVRDALLRLSQEEVVRAVGARGFIVEPLKPQDILDIYQMRLLLEVPAAVSVLPSVSARELDLMEQLHREIIDSSDQHARLYGLHRDFHRVLVDLSTNRRIRRTLNDLWDLPISTMVFRHQVRNAVDARSMATGHALIIDAVRTGEGGALRSALYDHLMQAQNGASKWIRSREFATEGE
jgi:DNA-binding GntR family transcriptional regulator